MAELFILVWVFAILTPAGIAEQALYRKDHMAAQVCEDEKLKAETTVQANPPSDGKMLYSRFICVPIDPQGTPS
jgi:hypothetical protein